MEPFTKGLRPPRLGLSALAGYIILVQCCICDATGGKEVCTWSYNSLHWDLLPLMRHRPLRDYEVHRGSWTFFVNPCTDTLRIPPSCPKAVHAPGYQTLSQGGEEACYILGNLETQTFGLLDEQRPEEGIKITYSAGTQCDGRTSRSMEFHFLCNPAIEFGQPTTVTGECRFVFLWETSLACPFYPNHNTMYLAWGLILLATYLVSFTIYNMKTKGLSGSAAVPHVDYLRALGRFLAYSCRPIFGNRVSSSLPFSPLLLTCTNCSISMRYSERYWILLSCVYAQTSLFDFAQRV